MIGGNILAYARNEKQEALPCGLTALSVFLLLQNLVVNSPLVSAMGKDDLTVHKSIYTL